MAKVPFPPLQPCSGGCGGCPGRSFPGGMAFFSAWPAAFRRFSHPQRRLFPSAAGWRPATAGFSAGFARFSPPGAGWPAGHTGFFAAKNLSVSRKYPAARRRHLPRAPLNLPCPSRNLSPADPAATYRQTEKPASTLHKIKPWPTSPTIPTAKAISSPG